MTDDFDFKKIRWWEYVALWFIRGRWLESDGQRTIFIKEWRNRWYIVKRWDRETRASR